MSSAYKFEGKYRGTALIIGNEFVPREGEKTTIRRGGCKQDVEMMKEVFEKLDFRVTPFMNLSAAEMKQKLEKASQDEHNKDCDCFVFVLSTHGLEALVAQGKDKEQLDVWEDYVFGEDREPLAVKDIIEYFKDNNAPGLAGKPKLFFLQACRSRTKPSKKYPSPGDRYDAGTVCYVLTKQNDSNHSADAKNADDSKINEDSLDAEASDVQNPEDSKITEDWLHSMKCTDFEDIYTDWEKDPDEWRKESSENVSQTVKEDVSVRTSEDVEAAADSSKIPGSAFEVVPVNCPDDFLIMYPVVSGKSAFREEDFGSVIFQYLHRSENLAKLLLGCNLLQYLTSVCQDMARYEFKPDLDEVSREELEKEQKGEDFERLGKFKAMLHGNIKFLSMEENQEKLLRAIGDIENKYQKRLKGDVSTVEPHLRKIIDKVLTEQQMKSILNEILPFKMTACVVHRLKGSVVFKPKKKATLMGWLVEKIQQLFLNVNRVGQLLLYM